MKKNLIYTFLFLLISPLCIHAKSSVTVHIVKPPDNQIKMILSEQEKAWNMGNLDGFMLYYWNNEELKFVSKNGIKKGWNSVYNSYQKAYAAKGEMGTLNFSEITIHGINNKNALVTGNWKVVNQKGIQQGLFTLWFKKIDGKWLIVMDHTS